jgi:hypothetical protein
MCSTVNHQSDRFSCFLRARMGTSVLVPLHIVNDGTESVLLRRRMIERDEY